MRHIKITTLRRAANSRGLQRGQAMVESALVLMSLLMMILFIMDMGRILFLQQYITERTRSTARAASVNNWNQENVRAYFCFNNSSYHLTDDSDESSRHNTTPGLMGIKPINVAYTLLGTPNTPNYRVRVTVSNVSALMLIPYFAQTIMLRPIAFEFPAQSMGASD